MKHRFSIISDGSCDLPEDITAEYNISIVHFLVSFDDETYKKESIEMSLDDFYKQMLTNPDTFPKTAAPSPEDFLREFTRYAAAGQDILCICISTKLSSAMQSAKIAKDMLHDEYPDVKVYVMDSLCATLMQSAFVLEACSLRDKGRPYRQDDQSCRKPAEHQATDHASGRGDTLFRHPSGTAQIRRGTCRPADSLPEGK